jgi:hypothetical protein
MNRILVISDLHSPFYHPDTVPFLTAIKEKYDPDMVICVGDELDHHCMSFHDTDVDMGLSASSETEKAIGHLVPIYSLFEKVKVMHSNHGSMVFRRAKAHSIPLRFIVDYNTAINAPKGWTWHDELIITLPNKQKCYVSHGQSGRAFKVSKDMCMNAVQGHWHNDFSINYWSNPENLYWSLSVGCLINDKELSFEYGRLQKKRPLIGCGMIIDSQPKLIPLVKNKNGRWNKKLV